MEEVRLLLKKAKEWNKYQCHNVPILEWKDFWDENQDELDRVLKSIWNDEAFQNRAVELQREKFELKRLNAEQKIKELGNTQRVCNFYNPDIIQAVEHLDKIKSFTDLINYYDTLIKNLNRERNIEDNFFSINKTIIQLFYDDEALHLYKIELYQNENNPEMIELYKSKGIDILKTDLQLAKYNLLSFDKNKMKINNVKEHQTIFDSKIDSSFFMHMDRKLLIAIEQLLKAGYIKDISFKITGVVKYLRAQENMERGKKLQLNLNTLPDISVFYSAEQYDNKLWVQHNKAKNSLTFEETVEQSAYVENNIITQVIHLEYSMLNDKHIVITHLDHEFILYTEEEFEKRKRNHKIKGHKKIKTFKIDHSFIPFNYKIDDEYFLYQVLDEYFYNKELISEYFSDITLLNKNKSNIKSIRNGAN